MTNIRLVIVSLAAITVLALAGITLLAYAGVPVPSVLEVVAGGGVTGLAAVLTRSDSPEDRDVVTPPPS